MFAGCYHEILFLLLNYCNINLKFPPNFFVTFNAVSKPENLVYRDQVCFPLPEIINRSTSVLVLKNTKNVSVFLLVSQIKNTNKKNKYINELIIL